MTDSLFSGKINYELRDTVYFVSAKYGYFFLYRGTPGFNPTLIGKRTSRSDFLALCRKTTGKSLAISFKND